jgi:hypothetical protein
MLTLAPACSILRAPFDKTRARTRRLCGRRMIFAGHLACFFIVPPPHVDERKHLYRRSAARFYLKTRRAH